MEKFRNYNQGSEEEILEKKQETLSEKESKVENIEIDKFEGEKIKPPENIWEYFRQNSPIIKAIENTVINKDKEKSLEFSIENLQKSTQEIIDFYQDLQEQLKDLDKENNEESDYASLVESDNLKDNLFFLKGIDKEKSMDFFQSTSNLGREERNTLIESLKNIKVFQEFKEKVQNIALLMIKKIEEIEESYKSINPTSIEKENMWDTKDLARDRELLKIKIDTEISKLEAIKVSLIYEMDLPKDSIQEDLINFVKLNNTLDKIHLSNDIIENYSGLDRMKRSEIMPASEEELKKMEEEINSENIFNKIYKNTLTQDKEFINLENIYNDTENIHFKTYLKDKIEENYKNLPDKEDFSMEELIQDITNYINLNRIYKEEDIENVINNLLATDKNKFLEKIGYQNENQDLSKEKIQTMFSDFDKIFINPIDIDIDIDKKIEEWSQLYGVDFKEFYTNNKVSIDVKIVDMFFSSDIKISIKFLNFLEKEQILNKKEFLEENQEKINSFIQRKIDRNGFERSERIFNDIRNLIKLISENDLFNTEYLNNYNDIVSILYLNVSQYSDLSSYKDVEREFNIDKSSLSDEDINNIINNYIIYKGKTDNSLFRNIVDLKIDFQINDLKLEFPNEEIKEKFYLQVVESISYLNDHDGRRLIKELFNNGSLDLDEFKNKYKKELDIEISQIRSLRDIKNLEGIINNEDFSLIVEQRIQDALNEGTGNLESLYVILYNMEIIEKGYKVNFLRNNFDLMNSKLENMISQYNSSNLIQDLKYWDGVEEGYAKNFFEKNKEKIEERVKNRFLSGYNIRYIEEELDYWNSIKPGYNKEILQNNKEKISNNIKISLGENIYSLTDELDYWDNIEVGYREEFFQENTEEINEIIIKSYSEKGMKVYKLSEKIGFKEYNKENSFVVKLVKKHNGLEKELIKGYVECKEKGIIKEENYEDILELVNRIPVLNTIIVKEYLEAKSKQKETEYLDKITDTMDRMTSGGVKEEERNEEYFQDLLEYTYPNNAGSYGKYESVKTCQDRSQDLEGFKIKEKYPINIVDKSKLELREGREIDKENLGKIEKEREEIIREYNEGGIEKISQSLDKIIEEMIVKIGEENKLGIQVEKLISQEEKIYAAILYSRLNKEIKEEEIKKSILYYNFSHLDNIERYQENGEEGIEKDYEKIMGLSEFYKDTIKEAQNVIVDKGKQNPIFQEITENVYKENQERERIAREKQELGKLQIDKLGLNDKFIKDMRNILIKRRLNKDSTKEEKARIEEKYSEDRVREIISRYESLTGFLEEKVSNSSDSNTKTFYGRLKGQRNKTVEAFRQLTGEEQDLMTTHLGDINLKEVIALKISASDGIYDEELFNRLIEQSVTNLYKEENEIIETEVNKFIMVDYDPDGKKIEKKPKKLNGYINKDDLSSYARMVGGVCVSGCNPDKGEKNIWDMPNYFQLVLQNPENKRCVGLVLLHHFKDEDGQKILSASYNPSSTYLYSVDQESLFNELNNTLIDFAKDNDFDKIAISKNKHIRTNRTDTIFEKSMDKAINKYKEVNNEDGNYSFSNEKNFSHYPSNYKLDNMDIVWSK